MHYVLGDIHNESEKLKRVLKQMELGPGDEVILLGDLFDRGYENTDPVEVYFLLSQVSANVKWVAGNHDIWLARYIQYYFATPERKREKLRPYDYNSFERMQGRLTEADLMELAGLILSKPLMLQETVGDRNYLFSHARTSHPLKTQQPEDHYLLGGLDLGQFFLDGIEGYVSICGHTPVSNVAHFGGRYLDEEGRSIWANEKGNVVLLDCGAGFGGGTLAGICLETGERFYSDSPRHAT